MEKIRFEPKGHKYFLGDQEIPGFTHIGKDLGLIPDNRFYTEAGREEGSALHLWVNFLARGEEPETEPDPRIAGRVIGFRRFLAESRFKFEAGEMPVYEPESRYACTPDLIGQLGMYSVVIEVKGGSKQKWHPTQTCAQKLALVANDFPVERRYCLYLKDAAYRLEEHADKSDEIRWKTFVAAYWGKKSYE